MSSAFLIYAIAFAALLTIAGLILERAAGMLSIPRRFLWLGVMLGSSLLPLLIAQITSPAAARDDSLTAVAGVAGDSEVVSPPGGNRVVRVETAFDAPIRSTGIALAIDRFVPWLCAGSSLMFVLLCLSGWFRIRMLAARAGEYAPARPGHAAGRVVLSESLGPAVFGFLRPVILLPAWLAGGDRNVRRLILLHEREHVRGRDQIWLLAALLIFATQPWNLPIWYQLRRFRRSTEIDCDHRVLRRGVDRRAYAEALLAAAERRRVVPTLGLAMTGVNSNLEARIREMTKIDTIANRRIALLLVLVATGLVIAACAVRAPEVSVLRKPMPSSPPDSGPNAMLTGILAVFTDEFENEIRSSDSVAMHMDLVLDPSGAVRHRHYEELASSTPDPNRFGSSARREMYDIAPDRGPGLSLRIIVDADDLTVRRLTPGAEIGAATNTKFLSVFLSDPGSHVIRTNPENPSAEIDRAIVERYFGNVYATPPAPGSEYWVLIDHGGAIVGAGHTQVDRESGSDPMLRPTRQAIEAAYPGSQIVMMVAAPITRSDGQRVRDRNGNTVPLFSAWLAAE